jgi:hypothetical protein
MAWQAFHRRRPHHPLPMEDDLAAASTLGYRLLRRGLRLQLGGRGRPCWLMGVGKSRHKGSARPVGHRLSEEERLHGAAVVLAPLLDGSSAGELIPERRPRGALHGDPQAVAGPRPPDAGLDRSAARIHSRIVWCFCASSEKGGLNGSLGRKITRIRATYEPSHCGPGV